MLKNFLKKFIPKFILSWYHLALAHLANFVYGNPSEKLIIIGVTGTNGKSTTVSLIAKILEEAGHKVAVTSTVNFKIGDREWLNDKKMTMPGRFFLQKLLSDSVKSGCKFAVIESSSEGILQHRHVGIHYDAMVFTNLTPEHIEAHGGFENYKTAKLEYFRNLKNSPHKTIGNNHIDKVIVANTDDPHGCDFLNFPADMKINFGKNGTPKIKGSDLVASTEGINFKINNIDFNLHLKGLFDFYNALAAVATSSAFGIDLQTSKLALEKISNIPGRMELIEEGQDFKVLVDYAYEPEEMRQVYKTISEWPTRKVIQVLGPCGGGRDTARIPLLGEMAGEFASTVFITTDDPYNDDPKKIGEEMLKGSIRAGLNLDTNLFLELDRRTAIAKALALAQAGDLILITGKGSDQTMAVKNGYVKWDDRQVVREELKKLAQQKTA